MRNLGVMINTNLAWGTHCRGFINKCIKTMGMIKRAVCFNAPVNVTTSLYRTLVRSNLEYCSRVWCPSMISDTKAIESIQRAATRYILIIRKLNTSNNAPCFICIHYLTDGKLQICYMFLNVLKDTMTYHGISTFSEIWQCGSSSTQENC